MMAEPIMFGQPGMGMNMEDDAPFVNIEIRDFFMGLINVGDRDSNKPRVIFLRDAAGMHATFDAWWPSFVAAVNLRRRGVYDSKDKDQVSSSLVNPTTIVLGVAPSLLHVGNHTGGGPSTFPLLGAREALYQALEIKDKASPSVNRHVRRRADPAHEEPDEAKLWMSSPETDDAGRELRATKRMNAMDNGVVEYVSFVYSLTSVYPTFYRLSAQSCLISLQHHQTQPIPLRPSSEAAIHPRRSVPSLQSSLGARSPSSLPKTSSVI